MPGVVFARIETFPSMSARTLISSILFCSLVYTYTPLAMPAKRQKSWSSR